MLFRSKGAQVLATYQQQFYQGQPVLTRNAVGSGVCYTLQARVEVDCLTSLLGDLLESHGIQPLVAGLPDGVIAAARYGEDGAEYLFLLNSNREDVQVQLPGCWQRMEDSAAVSGDVKLDVFSVTAFVKK